MTGAYGKLLEYQPLAILRAATREEYEVFCRQANPGYPLPIDLPGSPWVYYEVSTD